MSPDICDRIASVVCFIKNLIFRSLSHHLTHRNAPLKYILIQIIEILKSQSVWVGKELKTPPVPTPCRKWNKPLC